MKCKHRIVLFFLIGIGLGNDLFSQDSTVVLPKIDEALLVRDFDLLIEGLEKFHTGLNWYTPRDSFQLATTRARAQLSKPMDVLAFHRIIAPIIALSREDHTNVALPKPIEQQLMEKGRFFPLIIRFLDKKMYCTLNGSSDSSHLRGAQILTINGKKVSHLVDTIGRYFATDGYIQSVKYWDLNGFGFAYQHYLVFGEKEHFEITYIDSTGTGRRVIPTATYPQVIKNIEKNYNTKVARKKKSKKGRFLAYRQLTDSIAYLAVHSFYNPELRRDSSAGRYKKFLRNTFQQIQSQGIKHLILDISRNGGGHEGNENLLYSYLAENYQKYHRVKAKRFRGKLNNGVDRKIRLRAISRFEEWFGYEKQPDGTFERKPNAGHGVMAYKKEPKHKYKGDLYVMISPETYSGGSELANMLYTRKRGLFFGEETGGGFLGNTSGVSDDLELPHSGIKVEIPMLQYVMNVSGLPKGRGVVPHYHFTPTIEQYLDRTPAFVNYVVNWISEKQNPE